MPKIIVIGQLFLFFETQCIDKNRIFRPIRRWS